MVHAGRLIVMLSAGWLALRAAIVLLRAKSGSSPSPVRDLHDADWL